MPFPRDCPPLDCHPAPEQPGTQQPCLPLAQQLCQPQHMLKVCDGVYLGTEASIWDVDIIEANYITHLIRVGEQSGEQKYVPEFMTHVHVVGGGAGDELEVFGRVVQFVEHALEAGESCIFVPDAHDRPKYQTVYEYLYEPASVVCAYLMRKYHWAMLKAVQFVTARLMAPHKSAQALASINSKLNRSPSRRLTPVLYSQLLTHMLPRLPASLCTAALPQTLQIPLSMLSALEEQMMKMGTMSYGWTKRENEGVEGTELVLVNTYLNSRAAEDGLRESMGGAIRKSTRESVRDTKRGVDEAEEGKNEIKGILKIGRKRMRHSLSAGAIQFSRANQNSVKKLRWKPKLTEVFEQICIRQAYKSASDRKKNKQKQNKAQSQNISHLLRDKSIILHKLDGQCNVKQKTFETSKPRAEQQKIPVRQKNSIVLNVIDLINAKSKAERPTRTLINRKSSNNVSRPVLPTFQQVMENQKQNSDSNPERKEEINQLLCPQKLEIINKQIVKARQNQKDMRFFTEVNEVPSRWDNISSSPTEKAYTLTERKQQNAQSSCKGSVQGQMTKKADTGSKHPKKYNTLSSTVVKLKNSSTRKTFNKY